MAEEIGTCDMRIRLHSLYSPRVKHIEELDSLNLGILDYVIVGSGPLAVRGWRRNNNIDIIVKPHIWSELRRAYSPGNRLMKSHIGREPTLELGNVSINKVVPPFENANNLIMRGEIIEGHNYASLPDLIACKSYIGSPRDIDDINTIIRNSIRSELHKMLQYQP